MDLGAVATGLSGLLAPALPFLLGIGGKLAERAGREAKERLGDAGSDKLRTLWAKLGPALKKDPVARQTMEEAALDPQDDKRLLALAIKLQRVMEEDEGLAEEARQLLAHATSFQASGQGVAAQQISGSNVVTGSENVVQQGRMNVNFGGASNVTIHEEKSEP